MFLSFFYHLLLNSSDSAIKQLHKLNLIKQVFEFKTKMVADRDICSHCEKIRVCKMTCLASLRAYVLACLACSNVYLLPCLRVYVLSLLRSHLLSMLASFVYLHADMSYMLAVLKYLTCLSPCVPVILQLFYLLYIWKVKFQTFYYRITWFYFKKHLEPSWTSMMALFCQKDKRLKLFIYFFKKASSYIFDWVTKTFVTRIANMLWTSSLHKLCISIKTLYCNRLEHLNLGPNSKLYFLLFWRECERVEVFNSSPIRMWGWHLADS